MTKDRKILCVIPSRLKSTRLPLKPLALLANKPMIQWVYEAAISCTHFHKVIVATDAEEIQSVIHKINGNVIMTSSNIQTGSDRVAFVAEKMPEYEIIVNLQGDEPFVSKDMLTALIQPYLNGETPPMTTLACPIDYDKDYNNPNIVKVLYNHQNNALYFSRSPLPYFRSNVTDAPVLHHQGLYAFTRDFLLKFTKLPPTQLEKAELLEQLRALEHGYPIRVCQTHRRIIEINTPEELEEAREYLAKQK